MKKFIGLILVLFLVLFAVGAQAQTWHTVNQATVGWDPVTTNESGDTIPADQVSYKVYLCNAVSDAACATPQEVGQTSETTFLITLTAEGRFWFGVRAVRMVSGEVVGESAISWSNNTDVSSNQGLQYFLPPAKVGGLIIQ